MLNQILTAESEFLFMGHLMSLQEFADEYCEGVLAHAEGAIEILVKKGKVVFNESSTRQENALKHVAKEEVIAEIVDQFDTDELTTVQFKRDNKRAERAKYASIELPFPTMSDAQASQNYIQDKFFLETRLSVVGKTFVLEVFDITDAEVNAITRKYQLENAIDSTVNLVNKGVGGVSGAVDFTASRVLVPTFKVGATAGVAVAKTAVNTLAKTGSVLISSLIKGTKQAKKDLVSDREVLTAMSEIIDTKDSIARGVNKVFNSTMSSSAIKINK